jgi:hypothetical protein
MAALAAVGDPKTHRPSNRGRNQLAYVVHPGHHPGPPQPDQHPGNEYRY